MAAIYPTLGDFAIFPREVRDLIWQYVPFSPSIRHKSKSKHASNEIFRCLSILQASRQLYDEISPYLYDKEVLTFRLATNRRAFSVVDRLDQAISQGFHTVRYNKFREIKIEIEAPRKQDPGQMLCIWQNVNDVVELLSPSVGIRSLSIKLATSTREKLEWFPKLQPQRSIPADFLPSCYDSDYDLTMLQFRKIRNVLEASILISSSSFELGKTNPLKQCITRPSMLVRSMKKKQIFGGPRIDGEADTTVEDEKIQQDIDTLNCQFEEALDLIDFSDTAENLRVYRFASWFSDATLLEAGTPST